MEQLGVGGVCVWEGGAVWGEGKEGGREGRREGGREGRGERGEMGNKDESKGATHSEKK